jgi:2-C-methyl-D-erythritol 4-phosphate cytidylyltransferase
MDKNIGIIFAGGSGTRMGETDVPKQFLEVDGLPIIIRTLDIFESNPLIDEIYIACKEEYIGHLRELVAEHKISKVINVVSGGVTAQHSIFNGISEARKKNDDDAIVLIHDGVRPFLAHDLIDRLIDCVRRKGNAITATPCQETIIVSEDGKNVGQVPYRKETFSAQAPQAFRLGDVLGAHEKIRETNPNYENMVDQCTIFRTLGKPVNMVEGNFGNIKITNPEDVYILKALLKFREDGKR